MCSLALGQSIIKAEYNVLVWCTLNVSLTWLMQKSHLNYLKKRGGVKKVNSGRLSSSHQFSRLVNELLACLIEVQLSH